MEFDVEWLKQAIKTLEAGIAEKLSKGNVTVYWVKNVIRIDIKY